jgi:hypothetical protein
MNIVRTDWDLVQIATFTPDCLKGLQSQRSALNDTTTDLRASGIENYTPQLKEEVVKLVLPPENLYFTQKVNKPVQLEQARYNTPAEVTKMLEDISRANY